MYMLHFINSRLSLLLPGTVLPCQDSSAGPSVLDFLCLPCLISESRIYPRSISAEVTVPSFSGHGVMGTPTLQMAESFWDSLLQP